MPVLRQCFLRPCVLPFSSLHLYYAREEHDQDRPLERHIEQNRAAPAKLWLTLSQLTEPELNKCLLLRQLSLGMFVTQRN